MAFQFLLQGGLGQETSSLEKGVYINVAALLVGFEAVVGRCENQLKIAVETCWWEESLEKGEATTDTDYC